MHDPEETGDARLGGGADGLRVDAPPRVAVDEDRDCPSLDGGGSVGDIVEVGQEDLFARLDIEGL